MSNESEFTARGEALTQAEALALRTEVERDGDEAVAKRVGLSRFGLARAVARFTVSNGTRVLVRAYLTRESKAA